MKKLLTIAVALSLAAFAAQAVNHDISTGDLSITSGGSYTVTGSTTEYSVTVDTADPVTLTLDGVNINLSTASPVDIKSGSFVTILLVGDNTLKQTGPHIGAPINVPSGASVAIQGSGSLAAASSDNWAAAIGGGDGQASGSITIYGGNITANGGMYSSGIGGGAGQPGTVTIAGGTVKAYGGTFGSGIGGGTGWNGYPNVTITGGDVYAESGNGSGIGNGDEGGHYNIGTVTISGGTVRAHSNSGAGIGAGNASGESGRGPNIYISGGSIKATSTSGSPVGQGAGHGECPDPLTEAGGEVVYKATVVGAIADHSQTYTCITTRNEVLYNYNYSGSGHDSDANLYFYLPDGDYVVDNGTTIFAGTVDGAETFLTKQLVGTAYLDVSQGDILFTADGVSGFDENGSPVEGEYADYVINGTSDQYTVIVESGSHRITLNDCSISSTATSPFDICDGSSVDLVLLGSNSLTLTGERIGAPLHTVYTAYLTIEGSGSLTATSNDNWGAGIGGGDGQASGNITINNGFITARGGTYSAGIGGGAGQFGKVTINGGSVKAYGGTFGSGIGGGTGWGGYPNVTINGGDVYAEGGNGAGIGNGDEGGHNYIGSVTITGGTIEARSNSGAGIGAGNAGGESGRGPNIYISGGSIKASSNSGSPIGQGAGQGECPAPKTEESGEVIYKATLPDAMVPPDAGNFLTFGDSENVSFTTKKDGSAYSYAYSGTGYAGDDSLYFYLPDGTYIVEGSNGKSFGGTINGAEATFTVVPEPAFFGLALIALAAFLRRK